MTLLHEALVRPSDENHRSVNVAMGHGRVSLTIFDEIRKIIESAKQDLFFIDPYLDAEFVSRYLPHVSAGVSVRLLARKQLTTLLPAVEQYALQSGATVNCAVSDWIFMTDL